MIYLEKGQKLKDREDLVVYEATGERNDTDMVICAKVETPDEPFCWLEAQYITYGGLVYSISDDAELEKEILKIDPDSTINDVAEAPVESVVVEESAPATSSTATTPETVPDPIPQTPTSPASGEPISASGTTTPPVTDTASSTASSTPETVPEPIPEVIPEVVMPEPTPAIPEASSVTPGEESVVVPEVVISTSSRRGRRKIG